MTELLTDLAIRRELFWDLPDRLPDVIRNRRLIVERVLEYGSVEEFREILSYYGKTEIVDEVRQIGYLHPKTLEFVVSFFSLHHKDLKCCTLKPSVQRHWI